jgi:hypothetical protein
MMHLPPGGWHSADQRWRRRGATASDRRQCARQGGHQSKRRDALRAGLRVRAWARCSQGLPGPPAPSCPTSTPPSSCWAPILRSRERSWRSSERPRGARRREPPGARGRDPCAAHRDAGGRRGRAGACEGIARRRAGSGAIGDRAPRAAEKGGGCVGRCTLTPPRRARPGGGSGQREQGRRRTHQAVAAWPGHVVFPGHDPAATMSAASTSWTRLLFPRTDPPPADGRP